MDTINVQKTLELHTMLKQLNLKNNQVVLNNSATA